MTRDGKGLPTFSSTLGKLAEHSLISVQTVVGSWWIAWKVKSDRSIHYMLVNTEHTYRFLEQEGPDSWEVGIHQASALQLEYSLIHTELTSEVSTHNKCIYKNQLLITLDNKHIRIAVDPTNVLYITNGLKNYHLGKSSVHYSHQINQPISNYGWSHVPMSNYGWSHVPMSNYGWSHVPMLNYGWSHVLMSNYGWSHVLMSNYGWSPVPMLNYGWSHVPMLNYGWSHVLMSNYGWSHVLMSNYGWSHVPMGSQLTRLATGPRPLHSFSSAAKASCWRWK